MTTPEPPATGSTGESSGFFTGFEWSDGATIIAAIIAALIAASIAVVGYSIQRKITRRSERANLYGDAIGAVEAYLEGPYRIRRKIDESSNWFMLSSALSDAKTAISHHQALIEMHAPSEVHTAYKAFVDTAIREAGPQMTRAWSAPPVNAPTDVPLGTGYDRTDSDGKRAQLVSVMASDLKSIGAWWRLTR
ncbi:hypothetical protein ACSW29_06185 [Rhodococcus sp. GB-02]